MKTKSVKGVGGKKFLEMRQGACSVKIYSGQQTKNGKVYQSHYLTFLEAGKRQRQAFGSLEAAKAQAQIILTRLINGETAASAMRPVQMQEAALANAELEGLNVTLLTVAKEYRRAVEQLGASGTVTEAIAYYKKHAQPDVPKKTISEICAEMVAAKTADGRSSYYIKDIRLRLDKFAKAFKGSIADIKTPEIEAWLRGFTKSPKNRNNYANTVTTLFNFAKRAGYLSADRTTAAQSLSRARNVAGGVVIYKPQELEVMLNRLSELKPELLPFVAIGAFAGVRPAEMLRLTWDNIDFEQGLIEVGAQKAKTAQRRHIPIQPNLAAWLEPYKGNEGALFSIEKIQPTIRDNVKSPVIHSDGKQEPGIPWKKNALRHSYGSYRLPILKNANEQALEMGNSPGVIFRHYRELVKPAEAVKFWAIMPPADYAEKMAVALAKLKADEVKKKDKVAA